jgi:hypothetical protein
MTTDKFDRFLSPLSEIRIDGGVPEHVQREILADLEAEFIAHMRKAMAQPDGKWLRDGMQLMFRFLDLALMYADDMEMDTFVSVVEDMRVSIRGLMRTARRLLIKRVLRPSKDMVDLDLRLQILRRLESTANFDEREYEEDCLAVHRHLRKGTRLTAGLTTRH